MAHRDQSRAPPGGSPIVAPSLCRGLINAFFKKLAHPANNQLKIEIQKKETRKTDLFFALAQINDDAVWLRGV